MSFDEKKLLKRENLQQINNFILSDRKTLTLRRPSFLPGTLFSAQTTVLNKHRESLSDNGTHHLGFIYETNLRPDTLNKIPELKKETIPEHKPDADSFYWQTSQQHIQNAVDYGIFNPGAFTTKVIGALGRYRLDVLERAYHNGIISNKYQHKEMLLSFTQTRIRSLEALERLTNAYDFGKSTDENVHRILDTLEDYISQLNTLKQEVASKLKVLNDFDEDAQTKITQQLSDDILSAEHYRDALINAWSKDQINQQTLQNTLLNATGPRSIAHFIKLRMIAAVREAQEHNQNMTYSRDAWSLSRGQFNSYCEDALRVINEYQPDHHNPTLAEHQGNYTNANESVTINFDHLDKNPHAIRQHLMAITHIEGKDRIAQNEEGDYYIINDKQEKPQHKLKTTRLTGWNVQDSKFYLPKRLFSWVWNFIFVGLIGGLLIDLIPNLFLGLLGKEPRSFVGQFRSTFTPVCVKNTHYDLLAKKIEIPIISLGAKVGGAIGNFFRNTTWEIRNGVKTTFQQARFEIFDNLISDFQIWHNRIPDDSVLFDKIYSKLDKLQKKEKEDEDLLEKWRKKLLDDSKQQNH
jgi:hypothetical protein